MFLRLQNEFKQVKDTKKDIYQAVERGDAPSAAGNGDKWSASLQTFFELALQNQGPERTAQLLEDFGEKLRSAPRANPKLTTAYINTISPASQAPFPGNRDLERRIKSIIRWNAMAMVVKANTNTNVGGHISSFASSATLYEVAFNHFFRGHTEDFPGDIVYFQGHAAPGMYARAFMEGRLSEQQLSNFRQELAEGGGLSSYPHPYLMPDFWQFPTVSMGLGPILSLYQARFNRYLQARGLATWKEEPKVWAFLGDGESDEPESLGAITLAARENLDNVIWVVNCNLQRLDGPVRGNGHIVDELETLFAGAGWNVVKLLWGSDWDSLFARDQDGALIDALNRTVDGQLQTFAANDGAFNREHFFGQNAATRKIGASLTDEEINRLRRGGHDMKKIHAAYQAAARVVSTIQSMFAITLAMGTAAAE